MPVLRPLIGMDKDEITAEAQRLGTYPISIIPDQDCCTLFTPRHPATRARQRDVERAEAALDDRRESSSGRSAAAVVEDFRFPDDKMIVRFGPASGAAGRHTTVKITPGKLAGMKAVSNERGVIAAAAMDQRGSLQKSLAKEKGADVGDARSRSSRRSSPRC